MQFGSGRLIFAAEVGYLTLGDDFSGFDVDASDIDFGLNIGGGARYQAGDTWGVRPEIKFLVKDGSSARVSVGFYYSFGQ